MNHEETLAKYAEILSKYHDDNEEIKRLLEGTEGRPIITPEEAERIVEFYNNNSKHRKELTENVQDIYYNDYSETLVLLCRYRHTDYRIWFKVLGEDYNKLEGFILHPAYSVNKVKVTRRAELIPSIKGMINQVENFIRDNY